jgi:hypothetical protein
MKMSDNDEKNYKTTLNNNSRPKSPGIVVESLLSLDNTLLCNIETDSELQNSFETYITSQKCSDPIPQHSQVSKEQVQNDATTLLKISQTKSPELNEWQDKSLMDQIFAQFDSQDKKECSCNDSSLHISDTLCKEEDQNKSPILKTKSKTFKEYKIPKKKLCLYESEKSRSEKIKNSESNYMEHSSFYGLSISVKNIIQEVKGICELYRKLCSYILVKFKCFL